jgi:ribosomal protein L40E
MVESDYNSCPKCGNRFEEKTEIKREVKDNWHCRKCGALNSINTIYCRDCGTYR